QTELYRRTTALIRVDEINSYVVDLFRVKGGDEHHYCFHSAEGAVTAQGLELISQSKGSYAGEDVEFGKNPDDGAAPISDYQGAGFHWLKNVERDSDPGEHFSFDWAVKDTWNALGMSEDIHLRLTMLGDYDEIAMADGLP